MERQRFLPKIVELFVVNSSLRGVAKLYKTPYIFLKILWFIFIGSMIGLFLNATFNLVSEYFQYKTIIQKHRILHENTIFPSISVCPLQPFSKNAHKFWSNGTVRSPKNFTDTLRGLMRLAIHSEQWSLAENFFYQDDIEHYYQNLEPKEAKLIGQSHGELLQFCGVIDDKNKSVGYVHSCNLRIRRFSMPQYFNCYTIDKIGIESSKYVNEIQLIFYLGSEETSFSNLHNGLLGDLSSNSRGLKLKLHEENHFPNMAKDAINIGPGITSLISFKTHNCHEITSKTKKCFKKSTRKSLHQIEDTKSEVAYNYTLEACISAKLAQIVLERCGCVWPAHLSKVLPNQTHPYCGQLQHNNPHITLQRLTCVSHLNLTTIVKNLVEDHCGQICTYYKYATTQSSAAWLPKSWQLYWMHRVSVAFAKLKESQLNSSAMLLARQTINNFTDAEDVFERPVFADDSWLQFKNSHDYTLVRIQRSSFETWHSEEILTVTLSTLISRLGGMGSLTLGITVAALVELLEWLFLSGIAARELRHQATANVRKNSKENGTDVETQPMTIKHDATTLNKLTSS